MGQVATTVSRSEIEDIVVSATAAPSIMNSQPWRFRAYGNVIDLYADRTRAVDGHRPVYLSCGAALFNLRLAIAAMGRQPQVQLLPGTADSDLLARVTIGPPMPAEDDDLELYAAIPRRRTSRLPFYRRRIGQFTLAELTWHAKQEGAVLDVLTRRSDETTLVGLRTRQDGPGSALVAGQALERVLLAATVCGLSVSLVASPRALPRLRRPLLDGSAGSLERIDPSFTTTISSSGYCKVSSERTLSTIVASSL